MNCDDCKKEVFGDVCMNCGLIISDHPIIQNLDFKNQDEEKPLYMQKWDSPDISYATIHSKKTNNPDLKRAFNIEDQGSSKLVFGRSYINAYVEIKRICLNMGLSNVIRGDSTYLLRTLLKRGYIQKSYKKYASYAALIILAARYLSRLPISFAEIANHTNENIKDIKKIYNIILKELGIDFKPFTLEEIVNYHCNLLGIYSSKKRKCIKYAKRVKIRTGRIPNGYSAAVIRIVIGRSRKELSKILKVSKPIITARERELRKL